MTLAAVRADDIYTLESGRVFLSGIEALVRLPIMQRRRDREAGLHTAGFVSGYRGSPLGGLDQALWRAREHLERHHVRFQPAVNEDLAATAVWGTQQVNLFPGARYDGVFAMWYGKGPGVDRSGDVFKHANAAGTSRHGGVLVIAGDDHGCKSSTLPHQSDYAFMDAMIPVLNPAGVQEILDYGLVGWAMSRYSGCWVAMKTIAETVDSSATVDVDPGRVRLVLPEDFEPPPEGLNIRWPDPPLAQELRLHRHKLYAALAFARANRLDRVVMDSPRPRLGIVTTGKSYLDVLQALDDLGIDARLAAEIGLRVYKVGMVWPLEREGVRAFARGLEEILVVEEKRAVIENQLKEQLYHWDAGERPRVIGKFDEAGRWILPSAGELTPARIARAIAARIQRFHTSERIRERLAFLEAKERALAGRPAVLERTPHFCSGCPHNTSTRVPEGSRALGGIGCHYMATWMERATHTFTQMGGEGATWIGQAPFTETRHVFQNLGDGTYYHSGLLAIRAAVAAGVNITYKILYNGAVAMTGGQPVDGPLTVPGIARQVCEEGVQRIAVVSEEPARWRAARDLPEGTTVHHRSELDALQRELRETPGVSVLIYEQTCAAEKRRRRRRGEYPDPPVRVFINPEVCDGCGDCSVQSNCLSVVPVETPFGRKRAIDQSACNKDYTCLEGFCPSFVTVHGGRLRRRGGVEVPFEALPEPRRPALDRPYNIVITGIGGTGVVTIGYLLGMAAHLEGKGATVLDMTGLAQKYGAVVSHVRIAREPSEIHAVRVAAGGADLLLAADLVVASGFEALAKLAAGRSRAVVNTWRQMPAAFTRDPDLPFPDAEMLGRIREAVGGDGALWALDAHRLATALLGDAIGANLFLLGFAYQKGLVPVSEAAILRAVELNGVAVAFNRQAFLWGRRAAHDLAAVERITRPAREADAEEGLEALVERRARHLAAYQDEAYARRYRALVARVREAEQRVVPGSEALTRAVARGYHRLLAIKDEYEVARLHTDPALRAALEAQFEGDYRIVHHFAPPLLARPDPRTGRARKRRFGPWVRPLLRVLAAMRRLRGTPFDPFGRSAERRMERALIGEYEAVVGELVEGLRPDNHALAVEIAAGAERVRGFGPVKRANIERVRAERERLLARLRGGRGLDAAA
ncbi:indolepyruvate ferredoxin oxidoreductase family protein [Inmirania thermothiophila]|uniref:Indolepyruvate ferredoxin oxidoreductase n=1 Tax=Inmirania thermothiophila TaxID=1750597 RepID=A0A3N1YCT4_9GAMM|nr:indolepyruvate ferredoxin oxidoreductase family protein [Inmirania thermothiophila]ROR35207.1 indolepyruvate ferredoxin oxidoreductase [Inmirania thermothiophila]